MPGRVAAWLGRWRRDRVSGQDRLMCWLESPRYEELGRAPQQRFSGWALWYGERLLTGLAVACDGVPGPVIPVDRPREDLARNVHRVAGAARCGFAGDVAVPPAALRLDFTAQLADGGSEPFFAIDLAEVRSRRPLLDRLTARVDAVPVPSPEMVFLTQGMRDTELYRGFAIPASLNCVSYLERSGFDAARLGATLDFGCGSGRLLVGWHALAPERPLFGCDINPELVAWAQANLPAAIDVRLTSLEPPLPYADRSLDLVFAVSVFTHLPLDSQRRWAAEMRRILRPGGALLATLHGETYVPHIFPDRPGAAAVLRRSGHLVTETGAPGSNQFASLHTRGFARRLFRGFELAGFFPNGCIEGRRPPYRTFFLQDVYVFRRRG